MTNYMKGKSIIVTGAGNGFGRLVSQKAAALGANVTCVDVNAAALEETLLSIEKTNGAAQSVTADVTSVKEMKAVAAKALELSLIHI